ncbi:hypothetical protein C8J57DRAFT_1370527 [Mycena rebaudengoi]|nr:hypothetical protein C8J57DRAFT_1370527 [Mycena rebaudengoi]
MYSGDDLIAIARAVVDVNPYIAPYGKKGLAWQEIAETLRNQRNFHHKSINATTVQHKADALLSYKKDPQGNAKNLAKVIGDGKSASITIAALLGRMETQHDEAKDKTDEVKAKIKTDDVRFRTAQEPTTTVFMRGVPPTTIVMDVASTLAPAPVASTPTPTTLIENTTPPVTAAASTPALTPTAPVLDTTSAAVTANDMDQSVSATNTENSAPVAPESSLDAMDTDVENRDAEENTKSDEKKKSKRRRLMDRRSLTSSGSDALVELLKAENERRAAHDACVAESLDTFVKDSRAQKEEVTSLLKDLVNLERSGA